MENRIKNQAEAYRRGIEMRLVDTKNVVEWADGLISSLDTPDMTLVNISMSSKDRRDDRYEMSKLLMEVPGQISQSAVNCALFHLIREHLVRSGVAGLKSAESALLDLVTSGSVSNSVLAEEIYAIQDSIDIAISRAPSVVSPEKALADTMAFLDRVCTA